MPLTTSQINELIAVNIPNNTQQLITPAKVREVLLAMQNFADYSRQNGDTLQGVVNRGNTSNTNIRLVDALLQLQKGDNINALEVDDTNTAARTWKLPNEDGLLATRDWVSAHTTQLPSQTGNAGKFLSTNGTALVWGTPVATVPWGAITGTLADQTDLATALAGKAAVSHSHAIGDVTGLQAALDGKQAAGSYAAAIHTHIIGDVTGLQTALDGKAAATHSHAISDVTGLQTALDGKAAAVHGHAIADITGLQTALDGKAAASHTHPWSNITGTPTTLAGYGITNGVISMAAVGSSPNANGGSISGQTLTLQPANESNPGVVTTGSQVISGEKTFNQKINLGFTTNDVEYLRLRTAGAGSNTGIGYNSGNTLQFYNYSFGSYSFNGGGDFNTSQTSNQWAKIDASGITTKNKVSAGLLDAGTDTTAGIDKIRIRTAGAGSNTGIGYVANGMQFYNFNFPANNPFFSFNFSGDVQTSTTTNEAFRISQNYWYTQLPGVIGTAAIAHTSSILDIQSTAKGVLLPRMTSTQKNAISSPATSLMVYDTTDSRFYAYSSSWRGIAYADEVTGVSSIGTFSSAGNANGLSISGSTLIAHPATSTTPGMVTTGTQTFAGAKTFSNGIVLGSNGYGVISDNLYNMLIYVPESKRIDFHSGAYAGGLGNIMSASLAGVVFNAPVGGQTSGWANNTTGYNITAGTGSSQSGISIASPYGLKFGMGTVNNIYNRIEFSTDLSATNYVAVMNNKGLTVFGSNYGVPNNFGNASAALEVQTTIQGFLQPRMTTTQRNAISSPATGLSVYDIDTSRHMVYNGSVWKGLAYTDEAGGGTPAGGNTQIQYNNSGAFAASPTFVYNGSLGIGTASPAETAAIDISSTTKGFLMPRMTTTQKDAINSPAEGLMVYDLTKHAMYYYNNANWIEI